MPPPPKGRRGSQVPDHILHPHKYTVYTLDEPITVGSGNAGAGDRGMQGMQTVRGSWGHSAAACGGGGGGGGGCCAGGGFQMSCGVHTACQLVPECKPPPAPGSNAHRSAPLAGCRQSRTHAPCQMQQWAPRQGSLQRSDTWALWGEASSSGQKVGLWTGPCCHCGVGANCCCTLCGLWPMRCFACETEAKRICLRDGGEAYLLARRR